MVFRMEFSQFSSPFSALFLWFYLIHLHIFQMNFQLHVMCVIFAKEISLLVKSCTENVLLFLALIKQNGLVFWCTIGNLKDCVLFTFVQPEGKQPTRCHFCHARPKGLCIFFYSGSLYSIVVCGGH